MIKLSLSFLSILLLFSLSACSTVDENIKKSSNNYVEEDPFRSGERTNYNPGNSVFSKTKNQIRYCNYYDEDGFAYEAPCGKP
ncbi:hypothetical protein [Bartonella sp. HY761]|uniref:hypothetical protein n=1 Tax=Bartonella sp. HY761 TaxID=2979330 RepID=UPI0021E28BA5|nr:hypothetical protein [Bartonella sp. HY761]UXN08133.1 hypothetical protein N6A79_15540 [Bartonella sp. HY761]